MGLQPCGAPRHDCRAFGRRGFAQGAGGRTDAAEKGHRLRHRIRTGTGNIGVVDRLQRNIVPARAAQQLTDVGGVGKGEGAGRRRGLRISVGRRGRADQCGNVSGPAVLTPGPETGEGQPGSRSGHGAQVGKGGWRIGEEHHPVARDQRVGRNGGPVRPGVAQLEAHAVSQSGSLGAVPRHGQQVGGNVEAAQLRVAMLPGQRERQFARTATDVEHRVGRALTDSCQQRLGQRPEAAVGQVGLVRPGPAHVALPHCPAGHQALLQLRHGGRSCESRRGAP